MAHLCSHAWPGNVRELQNAIERAFALSSADTLGLSDLPPRLGVADQPPGERADVLPTLDHAERDLIQRALARSGGNKNEAARQLGIDRQRLYRKIEKFGL